MKNPIYLIFILIFFSCFPKEPEKADILPEINLSTAYAISETEIEISANVLANELNNEVEYGIVWSETPNPTIELNKISIGKINRGIRYGTKISNLKPKTNVYIRAFVKNLSNAINYSTPIIVYLESPKYWRRMVDLKIEEGQFSGIPIKLDGNNLTFIRLNENNEWEQYLHYNGIWYDPNYTWQKEKFRFTEFSPRQDPLFFSLNFSKDYLRPSAFLGGGYTILPQEPNKKNFLKDLYWVYDTRNYLEPMPLGDGPIAHFSLHRTEYLLEEENTNNFWSYFSLEPFIKLKPFPNIGQGYDYLGVSNNIKGYILAQKLDEKEVLLFEFDDAAMKWTQKNSLPNGGRLDGVTFSFKNKIYYGLGRKTNPVTGLSDIWEYDPETDKWTFITNYPGAGNIKVMAADMGTYAILFCGYQVRASNVGTEKYFNANDTWKFQK